MKELQTVLKNHFAIEFADKNLLETAFTHTSYANEHRLLKISHNERLEFLGDAVLQLLISEYLYKKYPKKPEGDLSKLRAMIVREESLAGFARDCQFDQFIKLGKGEENVWWTRIVTPFLGMPLKPFLVPSFWIRMWPRSRNLSIKS